MLQVKAIQQFYDGLPDQDLTVTQEEVERGWEATEHVYEIFGNIYGYSGQEFFPWSLLITPFEKSPWNWLIFNLLCDVNVTVYISHFPLAGMCDWMSEKLYFYSKKAFLMICFWKAIYFRLFLLLQKSTWKFCQVLVQ